jgi:ABC-type polysaccharide/polyol phosphate export permease
MYIFIGFVPMLLLSGIIWPIEGMQLGLRNFAKCLPFTLPAVTLRNIIFKGHGLANKYVLYSFGVIIFWLITFLILTKIALKLKK